jgi:hypothetical protein
MLIVESFRGLSKVDLLDGFVKEINRQLLRAETLDEFVKIDIFAMLGLPVETCLKYQSDDTFHSFIAVKIIVVR